MNHGVVIIATSVVKYSGNNGLRGLGHSPSARVASSFVANS